ncbi:MAG: hypothetical protein AB8H79_16035 [Myxococcota bacterium]
MLMSLLLMSATAAVPQGTTRHALSEPKAQVDAKLSKAVEETVGQIPWAFRGIARPKIAPLATACPAYRFHIEGPSFEVQCDGKDPVKIDVGGTFNWTSPEGDPFVGTLTKAADTYTLNFAGGSGSKRFIYNFGGSALVVTQEIRSPRLTAPMRWSLNYARE